MKDSDPPPPARTGLLAGLNRQIVTFGAVSLFTDIASEMIVPIRIIFLVLYLGTPVPLAGLIEGIAEGMSSLLKIASGRLADRVPARKPLLLVGYGLSAVAKPLLALVAAWPAALGLIAADRVGKGCAAAHGTRCSPPPPPPPTGARRSASTGRWTPSGRRSARC